MINARALGALRIPENSLSALSFSARDLQPDDEGAVAFPQMNTLQARRDGMRAIAVQRRRSHKLLDDPLCSLHLPSSTVSGSSRVRFATRDNPRACKRGLRRMKASVKFLRTLR